MSTHDDRISALEEKAATLSHNLIATQSDIFMHFSGFNRTVAALNSMLSEQEHALKDVHHEITIVTGVISHQGQDIKAIKEDLGTVKADLGAVKANVEAFEQRVNNRFEAQDKKLDQVLTMLSTLVPKPRRET